MALYERMTGASGVRIPIHAFCAATGIYLQSDVPASRLVTEFALEAGDITELDAIKATYDALATAVAKAAYLTRVHNVFLLCGARRNDAEKLPRLTKAEAKALLGF